MTYHLRFFREVEEDVVSSYAWYEEKADGLGEEFLSLFYASAAAFYGILCFPRKSTVNSGDISFSDFHSLFTLL